MEKLTLRFSAHSETGLVRKNNQDSGYASQRMLIVADGMGGAAAGDLASAVVVREMRAVDSGTIGVDMIRALEDAVHQASESIAALISSDPTLEGMGSTASGVLFDGTQLAIVNIGDSRSYLYRDGVLHRLTHDHSFVQTLIDEGRITEEESLTHPHRSLILRVINGQPQHLPDLELHDVREGDRLLICSDGLCGMVCDDVIARSLEGSREDVITTLLHLVYQTGAQDNITIILADVDLADAEQTSIPQTIGAATEIALDDPDHTGRIPQIVESIPRPDPNFTETARYSPVAKRRPSTWIKLALAILVPLALLIGGGGLWYSYTQQQYYVGEYEGTVAVFRGVHDNVLNLPLSTVVQTTQIKLDDLPSIYQKRVTQTFNVESLEKANTTITELQQKAQACALQKAGGIVNPQGDVCA